MALPQFTVSDLLSAGVHFGHRSFRWNPKLRSYIYGQRNGIHIIDITQTVPMLYTALAAVESTVARGGRVLFVGTKKQAREAVQEAAEKCGMFYINHRWLGGLLTNWKTVSKSIARLKDLEAQFAGSADAAKKIEELQAAATEDAPADLSQVKDPMGHYTKKERLMLERERDNLKRVLGGIMNMAGLPDLVVVLSVHEDKIAVDEANRLGIPVVGVVDTNASDDGVAYVIPGNDDSSRALSLYSRLVADAVLSGIAMQAHNAPVVKSAGGVVAARAPKKETTVTLSKKAQEVANAEAAAEAAAPAEAQASA
ncbi:MAG: 30S ribosomal protein S2 [Pseudomonadaceae bacterium]|nr:30S ribosomal protein S2 [Pseudomonadaceae bacterium]